MNKPSFNALSDRTALVVDDDPDMCWVLKTTLELFDYSAAIAENGRQALRLSATRPFPIAFIDARLPDMDGLQLATVMHSKHKDLRIIIISGFYSEDDLQIVEAVKTRRVQAFLAKPFQIDAIWEILKNMEIDV